MNGLFFAIVWIVSAIIGYMLIYRAKVLEEQRTGVPFNRFYFSQGIGILVAFTPVALIMGVPMYIRQRRAMYQHHKDS